MNSVVSLLQKTCLVLLLSAWLRQLHVLRSLCCTDLLKHLNAPPLAAAARLTGLPPKYFPVPIALMDGIIGIFDFLAKIFPALEVKQPRLVQRSPACGAASH
jgi:hypothetical protein